MKEFTKVEGVTVPIELSNIDTDMIIPKQFLKTIKRSGLGEGLFYEMRYDEKGNLNKDFILNQKPFLDSKILVAFENFGCGSSREHAPWALSDFGIRCVISSSFADIFYSNCFKNGILPIKISEEKVLELSDYSKRKEEIEVSLEKQEIFFGNKVIKFEIDEFKKKCLIEGLDDIDLSMGKIEQIDSYEKMITSNKPWILRND